MSEEILNSIVEMGADETLTEMVLKRLESLGYTVIENDIYLIYFSIEQVGTHIKNYCKLDVVPDGLLFGATDNVCGEFLDKKRCTGQLEGFDIEQAISSIDIGDTSVKFGSGDSVSERLILVINALKNSGKDDYKCYRKVRFY